MPIIIKQDPLTNPRVLALLAEHTRHMASVIADSTASARVLGVDGLRDASVTCYTAWWEDDDNDGNNGKEKEEDKDNSDGRRLVGIAALKEINTSTTHACEIKAMRTSTEFLRQGVGATLLGYVIEEPRRRGYAEVYAETGSSGEFAGARRLYEEFEFVECGPYAGGGEGGFSVFMVLRVG
ncbi:hypothetical protein EJ05DRAFT_508612 [Pseudovirgaria hyperparasitica]|uniref:N-acetyltransferase domain-containing protein n=1 Tax=Pseudovirgaria hyperparasitica TaxID=470096 RepID=A0A6A6WGV9_9PEZI|nr:uncharacterized protein EJ05DRAFT_508612 [Pseudovirgaria hyperparasitica]KAF2761449.1 hypothetical protein EJ05DRAFT_508612 [Pseudovirgaria hyperparasitica]